MANAEIFNHAALRESYGSGPGHADCAVLGPVWQALGDNAPAALDGQFAWVSLDTRSEAWIAARDHGRSGAREVKGKRGSSWLD